MKKIYDEINKELEILEENNLIRKTRLMNTVQSAVSRVDDKEVLLFSSSNYVSYAQKVDMKKVLNEVENMGIGSGGSRLTTGNNRYHELLESKLADFFGYDSGLLFNSGYCANIGVIQAIANRDSEIFSDEKNHASIIDGCSLSKAKITVYKHLDMCDLEEKLRLSNCDRKIIVSDGVFSMDGDILNLPVFCEIADKYNAISIVDDAHGLGVIGERGKGIIEYYDTEVKPDILIGTLSKSISSEGGFACSNKIINTLLFNRARSFIFSTSLSPFTTCVSYEALRMLEEDNREVKKLQSNIDYLIENLKTIGINIKYRTAIIPIQIGSEQKAMEIGKKLLEEGILITPIRYPAVPKGKAILRLTLMAEHSYEQIDKLVNTLNKYLK